MIEISEWALEVLARASQAARRLNPDARVRISLRDGMLESSLTDTPEPGDDEVSVGREVVLVDGTLDGLIDVEAPHDRLVLRPSGSPPAPRPDAP